MPVQYITLRALSKELTTVLAGSVIRSVFTQRKNEILIGLGAAGGEEPREGDSTLCISVEPRENYLFYRRGSSRAKKNSVDLLPGAVGAAIEEIFVHPRDRSLCIRLNGSRMIVAQLYNTAASNVYLTDDAGLVLDAFKEAKKFSGTSLNLPPGQGLETETISCKIQASGDVAAYDFLKNNYPLFGAPLIVEILHRSSVGGERGVGELSAREIDRLSGAIDEIFSECEKPSPHLYETAEGKRFISAVRLLSLDREEKISFPSVNEAIRNLLSQNYEKNDLEETKQDYLKKLKFLLRRDENAVRKMAENKQRAPGDLEKTGNVLLANLHNLKKGMDRVEVEDIYGGGGTMKIELDRSLTPSQNAERYFEKEKRAVIKRREEDRRGKELRSRIETIKNIVSELDRATSREEFKLFQDKHHSELKAMDILASEKEKENRPPFRIFTVAGEFEVWVGKSSANNDLLTTKYCKPHDLWFHARGAGGSHTVLKVPKGTKEIPRESIKQAARIAAYYSKMRKASNVPVAYCERKYVRKPKGVKEGTVYLEREEVVFVAPGLP